MEKNVEIVLDSCPFCGKEATMTETGIGFNTIYYGKCWHCGAQTRSENTPEAAAKNWNTRVKKQ